MGLFDIILIILSGVAIWIFYLLCSRIPKKPANAYLALLMLAMFLTIFWLINLRSELYLTDRILLFLPIMWTWGVGAISFLYLRAILYNRSRLRWSDLFFFVPLMVQIGFHTYWFVQPFGVKLDFLLNRYLTGIISYEQVMAFLFMIPLDVAAFIMTIKFTRKNWKLVTKESQPILVWARSLSVLFLIRTTAFTTNIMMIWVLKVVDFRSEIVYEPVAIMLLIILWLAYYITKHPAITMGYIKYTEASQKNTLFEQKLEKLVEQRIYDPDLGPHPIAELAKLMEVETTFLGKYFKIHMNGNYSGYVRKLRMQKFQDLVEEAEQNGADIQMNLLQKQCGYRNRSSFHRDVRDVFKASPSEYIENIRSGPIYTDID